MLQVVSSVVCMLCVLCGVYVVRCVYIVCMLCVVCSVSVYGRAFYSYMDWYVVLQVVSHAMYLTSTASRHG